MNSFNSPWFYWAIGVAIGFPVGLILLTELHHILTRKRSRLARQVGVLRNWLLPIGALLLLLVKTAEIPAGDVPVRLLTTVFGFLVLVLLLSGLNATVFEGAPEDSWRKRLPAIFLDVGRFALIGVGLTVILSVIWGVRVGGVFTALGITSVVIGLMLQNSVGQIVSGLFMLFEQPFRINDWLDTQTARGLVDVAIPRGGAGLIEAVVRDAQIPTIETGVGNCHVYVHEAADLDVAERILLNSKTRRPSVCNAAETLLVDAAIAAEAMPRLLNALKTAGVTVHGGAEGDAEDADLRREYLAMDIAVAVVDGVDAAIAHVNEYGTGHTEAIVTTNLAAAQRFTQQVDAAAVMVNASTAFTDGEQFGFGAEIGISTQKLHARGPMGLPELTSTKWIVWGDGHTRPA